MEERNNVAGELSQLSPYLLSYLGSHPFIVPEGYFEDLEDNIFLRISVQQETDPSLLPIFQSPPPFGLPGNYFETLPQNILETIRKQEAGARKVVPMHRRFAATGIWLAAASVAVLLLVSVWLLRQNNYPVEPVQSTAAVVSDENSELLMNAAEIDEDLVVQLLVLDEMSSLPASNTVRTDPALIDVTDIDDEWIEEI